MRHALWYLWFAIAATFVTVAAAWCVLALWYRLPVGDAGRLAACAAVAALACACLIAYGRARRVRALVVFALVFAAVLSWWRTIDAPGVGNWAPEVSRQVTGRIDGDILTLENVREFVWRTREDYDQRWTTRTYDLSGLTSLDMFLSYWSGPEMAHFVLSFGFEDGTYLPWSIEVRREVGAGFSPVADFFKQSPLVILASTERDVLGLRTNVRGENVQLFRLGTTPARARDLLEEYVRDANALAERPQWYNSLTTNCTTVVLKMLEAIGNAPPFDWRIVANGYLPGYAYDRGSLAEGHTLAELRQLGSISAKGRAYGLRPGYAQAIREGVPQPRSASGR